MNAVAARDMVFAFVSRPPAHDRAGRHSSNRLFEWIMAGTMFLIGFTLALPGDTLERGALRMIADLGADETWMAALFASVGVARGAALFANGALPIYGPIARCIGSLIGSFSWGVMMMTLTIDSMLTGTPSFVMPIFGMLALGEVASCYWAVRDGGFRKL